MTTTTNALDTIHQQHHALTTDEAARVILCTIIEPGDFEAGKLVSTLGAADAVRAIFDPADERATPALRNRALPQFSIGVIEVALRAAARLGVTLVTPEHPHWPTRVNDLGESAPFALWVRGNSELLTDEKTTGVVGARAATGYGLGVTTEIVAGLVDRGHTIASSAAYGVDGTAHRAALHSGGRTVAYLAGGVDRFYPSGHDSLLTRIVEEGAVVSEVRCGVSPTKWLFLQRNRIIAANSNALVVTEAGWRSASLDTASHAMQLGRPVGAVPGPVTSAASSGTHRLIRESGATLVTSAEEAAEL